MRSVCCLVLFQLLTQIKPHIEQRLMTCRSISYTSESASAVTVVERLVALLMELAEMLAGPQRFHLHLALPAHGDGTGEKAFHADEHGISGIALRIEVSPRRGRLRISRNTAANSAALLTEQLGAGEELVQVLVEGGIERAAFAALQEDLLLGMGGRCRNG